MLLLLSKKGKTLRNVFFVTFILLLTVIMAFVIPVSASPRPIYGYAEKSGGSSADGAYVKVTSNLGTVDTYVGPAGGWESGYWMIDVGDPGQNWTDDTTFSVTITDGDWTGSGSGNISGNYIEVANITLTYEGGSGGGGATPTPNNPPTADAGGPYRGYANNSILFDGTGSNDTDGTIQNYTWSFGDGTTGYDATTHHTYSSLGNYTVLLTVKDEGGATDSESTYADISTEQPGQKPVAVFFPPSQAVTNETVTFFGGDSYDPDGNIVNYTWTFDDGTIGYGESPTHVFTLPDTYVVTLTVTDDDGKTDTTLKTISVFLGISIDISDGYVIDDDGDGEPDEFFNASTGEMTTMQKQADGTYLIDTDNDGIWDHVYNPSTGNISPYEIPKKDEGIPWWAVAIIFIVIILLIIGILFYTDILYIEK